MIERKVRRICKFLGSLCELQSLGFFHENKIFWLIFFALQSLGFGSLNIKMLEGKKIQVTLSWKTRVKFQLLKLLINSLCRVFCLFRAEEGRSVSIIEGVTRDLI